jgi:hypothetical protein
MVMRVLPALLCALVAMHAYSQTHFRLLAGPRYEAVTLQPQLRNVQGQPVRTADRYTSDGMGWSLGTLVSFGKSRTSFTVGAFYAHQNMQGCYTYVERYSGLASNSITTFNGCRTERRSLLEAPALFTFGGSRIQAYLGLSYWWLLDVQASEQGIRTRSWWVYGSGEGTDIIPYHVASNDRRGYVRHGPSVMLGTTVTILERGTAGLFYTGSLWELHTPGANLLGKPHAIRLNLGYLIHRPKDGQ